MSNWQEIFAKKCIAPEELPAWRDQLRREGKSLATLNGSFDLLHAGHLHILFEASLQADILLVALNSDHSIQSSKGRDRPIVPLNARMQLVAALECVDYVTHFDASDPRSLLKSIAPDVHVNGEEYGPDCIESTVVQRIHLVNRIPGLSTSGLINRVKQCVK